MITGLFIGRFQPFHNGHVDAIKYVLEHCDKVLIVVGSSDKEYEEDNPFSVEERETMIREGLEENNIKNYEIITLPDYSSDSKWRKEIRKLEFDVVFSNSNWVKDCLKNDYEIFEIPIRVNVNAAMVRRKMYLDGDWEELVPKAVAEYIKEINGVERVKKLVDQAFSDNSFNF